MSDRPETGTMAFGDDWPGIFIRGDNAAYYGMTLLEFLKDADDLRPLDKAVLEGLGRLLLSATEETPTQELRVFNECKPL